MSLFSIRYFSASTQTFNFVLNDGHKVLIIGEEGNGKSTLKKWIYNPILDSDYMKANGERILLESGIRLFRNAENQIELKLTDTRAYNGMVELIYV